MSEDQLSRLAAPATAATAGMPSIDDAINAGSWLVGPAERLIDAFGGLQETYPGLDEVMVAQPVGAQPQTIYDQMERFAAEVMPSFAAPSDQ